MRPEPVTAINQAVTLAEVKGLASGLATPDEIDTLRLADHGPLHIARAALIERGGRFPVASIGRH